MSNPLSLSLRSISPDIKSAIERDLLAFTKAEQTVPLSFFSQAMTKKEEEGFIAEHSLLEAYVEGDEDEEDEIEASTTNGVKRSRSIFERRDELEEIEDRTPLFRLLAHALLDDSLLKSALEGANESVFGELFCEYVEKIPFEHDTFSVEGFTGLIRAAIVDNEAISPRIVNEKEVYSKIFCEVFSVSDFPNENPGLKFIKKMMGKSRFQAHLIAKIASEGSSVDFIKNFERFNSRLVIASKELIQEMTEDQLETTDDTELRVEEYLTFDHIDFKKIAEELNQYEKIKHFFLLKTLFQFSYRYIDQLQSDLEPIQRKLLNSKIGESHLFFSGYYNLPVSHAILVQFTKTAKGLWSVKFINTGEGINYHLLLKSDTHRFCKPDLEFQNVPEIMLFSLEKRSSFFCELMKYRSPYHYLFTAGNFSGDISKRYYEFIQGVLGTFQVKKPEDGLGLITIQKSGTCVYRSMKAFLQLELDDLEEYKRWMYQFKLNLLMDTFYIVRSDVHSLHHREIVYYAAERLIDQVHKDLARKITYPGMEAVLATALEIKLSLSFSDRIYSVYSSHLRTLKSKPASAYLERVCTDSLDFLNDHLVDEDFDLKAFIPTLQVIPNYDLIPELSLSEEDILNDLNLIDSSIYKTDLLNDYCLAIPLPKDWKSKPHHPKKVIAKIQEIATKASYERKAKNFVSILKLYTIAWACALEIHPFLREFPIASTALGAGFGIEHLFLLPEPQTICLKECLEQIKAFNATASSFTYPLFHHIRGFQLPTSTPHAMAVKDATIELYLKLLDQEPRLYEELISLKPENSFSKLKLIEPLVTDFFAQKTRLNAVQNHLLERFNFREIASLKNIYAALEESVNRNRMLLSEGLKCEADLSSGLFKFSTGLTDIGPPLNTRIQKFEASSLEKAIERKQIYDEKTKTTINWSGIEASQLEVFFKSQAKAIFRSTRTHEEDQEFVLEILTNTAINRFEYKKIIEIFAKKENIFKLNEPLYYSLFLRLFFHSCNEDLLAEGFILALAEDEALRKITADLFRKFIAEFKYDPHVLNNCCHDIIKLVFEIKKRVEKIAPFIPELQELISTYYPDQLQDYFELFREDKATKEYFLDTLRFTFSKRYISYTQRKLIQRNLHLFDDESFQRELEPIIIGNYTILQSRSYSTISLDKKSMTIWFNEDADNGIGISLSNLFTYQKRNGIISDQIEEDLEFSDDQYFVQTIYNKFPDCFLRKEGKKAIFFSPFGTFIHDRRHPFTYCQFAADNEALLPSDYQNLTWTLITSEVTDDLVDPDEDENWNPIIRIDKVDPSFPILSKLPYHSREICQFFMAQKDKKILFVAINADFNIDLLVEIDGDHYEILDIKEKKKITFLSKSYPLASIFEGFSLYFNQSAKGPVITISDEEGVLLNVIESGFDHVFGMNPDYIITARLPAGFPLVQKAISFQSKKQPNSYFVALPSVFYDSTIFGSARIESYKKISQIMLYRVDNGEITCRSLKEAFYLAYLKILNNQADKYSEIDKFIDLIRFSSTVTPSEIKFLQRAMKILCSSHEEYGIHESSILVLILKTLNVLYELDRDGTHTKLSDYIDTVRTYLRKEKKLPVSARLKFEELRTLETGLFQDFSPPRDPDLFLSEAKMFLGEPEDSEISRLFSIQATTQEFYHTLPEAKTNTLYMSPFGLINVWKSIPELSSYQLDLETLIEEAYILPKPLLISRLIQCSQYKQSNFSNINCAPRTILISLYRGLLDNLDLIKTLGLHHLEKKALITALYSEPVQKSLKEYLERSRLSTKLEIKGHRKANTSLTREIILSSKKRDFVPFRTTTPFSHRYHHELIKKHFNLIKVDKLSSKVNKLISKLKPYLSSSGNKSPMPAFSPQTSLDDFFHLPIMVDFPVSIVKPLSLNPKKFSLLQPEEFKALLQAIIYNFEVILRFKEDLLFHALQNVAIPQNSPLYLFASSLKHSSKKPVFLLDQLCHFLLDHSIEPLSAFLGLDQLAQHADTKSYFEEILETMGEVLFLHVELRQLRQASELTRPDLSQKELERLDALIYRPRDYSSENIHWLVFEYHSHFLIRPDQIESLKKLEKINSDGSFENQVIQMMMGGGKTSVISTLLASKRRSKEALNILVTPSSQLVSVIENLRKTLPKIFKTGIYHLNIKRCDMTVENLDELRTELLEAQNSSTLIVTTPETIQGLELEFIDQLDQHEDVLDDTEDEDDPEMEKLNLLREILSLIANHADAVVDEFAHIADVNKLTNFPLANPELGKIRIEKSHVELYKQIFLILCSSTIMIDSLPIQMITRIHLNEQMFMDHDEWQKVIPYVAHHLSFYLKDDLEGTLTQTQINAFLSHPEIDPTLLNFIQRNKEIEEIKVLALAHFTLHQLLFNLFKKCGGRNYGRKPTFEKIIPYLGVGIPASTEFGFIYETLCYHFCTAAQGGVSPNQVQQIASRIHSKAQIKAKAAGISVEETKEGLFFSQISHATLSEALLLDRCEECHVVLEQERVKGDFRNIFELEAFSALENVTYYPEYLSSNPHNLFSQFASIRGLTGTPWNHLSYQQCFQDRLHLDEMVEEKLKTTFLTKPIYEGIGSYAHITETSAPSTLLSEVLAKLSSDEKTRVQAIIDCGGLFKEYNNKRAATLLLTELKKLFPEKRNLSIIYFDKSNAHDPSNCSFDEPCYIDGASFICRRLPSLSKASLDAAGLLESDYFVYFDERHTLGTDVPLRSDAISLVTIDEKTAAHQFFQALLRMRNYFAEQNAITIIPSNLTVKLNLKLHTPSKLYQFLQNNQNTQVSKLLAKSLKMQLIDVVRNEVLNLIREGNYYFYRYFKELFVTQEEINPIDFLATTTEKPKMDDVLYAFGLEKYELLKKVLQENLEDEELISLILSKVKKKMEEIFKFAKEKEDSLSDDIVDLREYEVTIEQDLLVEQEKETELEREIDLDVQKESAIYAVSPLAMIKSETPIDFKELITHFSFSSIPYESDGYEVAPISELQDLPLSSYRYPYYECFDQLYITSHTLNAFEGRVETVLSPLRKKITSILAILSLKSTGGTIFNRRYNITTIGLNAHETEQALIYLRMNPQSSCFLLSDDDQLLVSNPQAYRIYKPEMIEIRKKAILELRIFNHEIQNLIGVASYAHKWLTATKPIDFYMGVDDLDEDDDELITISLGDLRKRMLNVIAAIHGEKNLVSIVDGLVSGELAIFKEEEEKVAYRRLALAQSALTAKKPQEVITHLRSVPKKFADLVTTDLMPFLPSDFFEEIKRPATLARLPKEKYHYLSLHQMPHLKAAQRDFFIGESHRPDLDPFFSSFTTTARRIAQILEGKSFSYLAPITKYKNIIGFPNLVNTCFANASLKAFFALPAIAEILATPLVQVAGETAEKFSRRQSLQQSLTTLYQRYIAQDPDIASFLKAVFRNPLFNALRMMSRQEDAEEFFKVISMALILEDRESDQIHVKGMPTNMIPLNFVLDGHQVVKMSDLIASSIADGYNFGHGNPALMRRVSIQLPRFTIDAGLRTRRNNQLIQELLNPFELSINTPHGIQKIRLTPRSFVCQTGSLGFGHYTAVTLIEDTWVFHDDSSTSAIVAEDLDKKLQAEAYLAFYDVALVEEELEDEL